MSFLPSPASRIGRLFFLPALLALLLAPAPALAQKAGARDLQEMAREFHRTLISRRTLLYYELLRSKTPASVYHYHSTHVAGTMIASSVVAAAKGMYPGAPARGGRSLA